MIKVESELDYYDSLLASISFHLVHLNFNQRPLLAPAATEDKQT